MSTTNVNIEYCERDNEYSVRSVCAIILSALRKGRDIYVDLTNGRRHDLGMAADYLRVEVGSSAPSSCGSRLPSHLVMALNENASIQLFLQKEQMGGSMSIFVLDVDLNMILLGVYLGIS